MRILGHYSVQINTEQAYFVRSDRTTMTQNDIDNDRLVCLIGVAPLRPAEFVIFRIGQKMADHVMSQLPGIYFQQQGAPPPQVLPRMDIAGFVGLAAQGSLHTPKPIEDMSSFQEIFGGDLPLESDAGKLHAGICAGGVGYSGHPIFERLR